MTPERWQKIKEMCDLLLDRKPEDRVAFLASAGDDELKREVEIMMAQATSGDRVLEDSMWEILAKAALRRQIESLVAQEGAVEDFVEKPALAAGGLPSREALSEGQTFGPYQILSLLGKGGMGAVYKARDSRLKRTVAIKILIQSVSQRPDLRERFRREAQAIARLDHPNICVIYDVGQQNGVDYLVMEYLEGESLARRLERGPLSTADVIKIAAEIIDALGKVHRSGVVHRDLKPSNIMLTRSGAKLLDFGLAKLTPNPAAELTETDITAEGTLLGTLQYMAPEQVQGKEADPRSDIFALGVTLYEMTSGRKAFEGKNPASVIAAILEREPEFTQTLQDRQLRGLEYLIRKCIAKNPDDRWQNAHDLLLQLHWIAHDADAPPQQARSWPLARTILLIGALATLLTLALIVIVRNQEPGQKELVRFPIYPPQDRPFLSPGNVSPDGRTVAFLSKDEKGERVIWLRSLESVEAKPLRGTEEALAPFFWSPDSKQIGFSTPSRLKKMALAAGLAQTLAEVSPLANGASAGGTWSSDGTILFTPGPGKPLFRIAATGGVPSPATTLDETREETGHFWPYFLPDGKHFLYLARSQNFEKTGVYVGLVGSTDRKRILDENTLPTYAAPGYMLFVRGETLLAQRFDTARLELSGNPFTLASGLKAVGWYSVSQNGVLTVESDPNPPNNVQLVWFGRKGQQIASLAAPGIFYTPVLSPDGRQVAVERYLQGVGLNIWFWLLEGQQNRLVRFTLGGPYDQTPVWSSEGKFIAGPEDEVPVWSHDGKSIAFTTETPLKGWVIRRKRTDGLGESEDLATLMRESYTTDWSPDGQYIAYDSFDQETRWDCWLLPVMGDRKPRALLKASFNERQLQFSPDGRWIAYTSNLSGQNEVYVQRFPISDGKLQQISSNGGAQPRWRRDGRELFYIAPDQKLMAVEIRTSPIFEAGSATELFPLRLTMSQGLDGVRNHYDVSADGQRFLVNTVVKEPSPLFTVTLDWTAALTRQ